MSGSYNAGSIEASLRLDRSDFNRELGQAKKDAEEFANKSYSPKVSLDDTEAKAKLAALKTELQNLHNVTVSAALSGFDGATTQLTALRSQVDALNGAAISIRADVDISGALASLATLRTAAADPITIHADVDTRVAAASLAALRAAAASPITIPTNPSPGDPSPAPGRPTPTPTPTPGDGDTRRNRKLKDPFNLPLGSLFSLPGLIATVLPQLPALTALLGGATAAVASFGVAAIGAMGIYGAATMGAVKQASAHKAAVEATAQQLKASQATLARTTAGTQSYKDALTAVTAAEKAHKKALEELTPVEKHFTNALEGTKTAWSTFIGSTEKYTLKPVATVLSGVSAALPKLTPLVKDLAPVIQDVATGLKRWMSGSGLERFVGFLRTTGVPILRNTIGALRGFMTAGGALIRAFAPVATRMSGYFKELGDRARAWGENGGAERFRVRFVQSWHQLKPIFQTLISMVTHVWDLLKGTGQPNASALVGILGTIADTIGNLKPAAVKAFSEIFMSLTDVAEALAPVLGITAKAIVITVNALPPGTIRAIADAMIAWKLAVIAWNTAMMVWTTITAIVEGFTLAWRVLGFVFAATPLGVIITIAALVVGALILIATKTTWLQDLWHWTWEKIKQGFSAAVEFLRGKFGYFVLLLGPLGGVMWIAANWGKVWGALKSVWSAIADKAMWLWHHGIKPTYDGIVTGLSWVWKVLKPVFSAIGTAFEFLGKTFWRVHVALFKVVFILIEAAVKALWVFVLKPVFGWIASGWHALGVGMRWVWEHILKPAWNNVEDAAKGLWKHGIKPALGWIKGGWDDLTSGIKWAWNHVLKPVWDNVADKATSLWRNHLKPAFDGIANTLGDRWAWIKTHIFSPMGTFFTKTIPGWGTTMKNKLIEGFDAAWKGIKAVWDNVKKAIGSPIYLVAKYVWNDAIYGIMDKIAGFVHQKNPLGRIPTDKIPHFAQGGPVPHTSRSTPGKDSVNALLMPDEHVLTTADVAAMGGQHAVMRFRSALHGGKPVGGANSTGRFGIGGWVDSVGGALKSTASKTIGNLKDAVLGAVGVVVNPLLNKAEHTIDSLIPNDGGWDSLANGAMKQPVEWIKGFIDKQDKKAQSVGGVIPTGQHLAIIDAALKAAGAPPPGTKAGWEAGLNTLIQRESGWNASAINNTDSNAKAGHPSQGLAQTIPSTFNAYVPSSLRGRGILDPVANVAAAIRYIIAVYGGIQNVQQAHANKTPKGYWTGTSGAAPGLAWVGERGPELIDFHGGEKVYNNRDSMQMHRSGILGGHLRGYANGTADQRRTVRHAYNERDDDVDRRNKAQDKYSDAHKKYLTATTKAEQQAARREMEKYANQIHRANKEIANDNKLIKLNEKKYKDASKAVEQERKDAETLAHARKKARNDLRDRIEDYIDRKKAHVDARIATARDARNGYYDAAVQTGQLSGLSGNRVAGFTSQLKAKIKSIQDFQKNLHSLYKLGLSRGVIRQIAAMGPDQGGELAQSLARTTTKADAAALNKQYAALEKASDSYADSAANDGYGLSKLKKESHVLGKMTVKVKAPHTIIMKVDGHTFKAYTEKVAEEKVTHIVEKAGKKK